jgi:hypothetical protein
MALLERVPTDHDEICGEVGCNEIGIHEASLEERTFEPRLCCTHMHQVMYLLGKTLAQPEGFAKFEAEHLRSCGYVAE